MYKVISVEIQRRKDLLHYKSSNPNIKQNDKVIISSLLGEEMGHVVKVFGDSFDKIKNSLSFWGKISDSN